MRNLIIFLISMTLFLSCTKQIDTNNLNHEILNAVLEDRLQLDSSKMVLQFDKTADTIDIKQIILVGQIFKNCKLDTLTKEFRIFTRRIPYRQNQFFENSLDYIRQQLRDTTPQFWNSTLIDFKLRFAPTLTEKKVSFIGEMHNKNSYLVVSNPLVNTSGEVLVFAQLYTKKYFIDKVYIFRNISGKWQNITSETNVTEVVKKQPVRLKTKDGWTETTEQALIFKGILK